MADPQNNNNPILFRISGSKLALFILPYPIVGFVACVVLSLLFNFEGSTATHCEVPNYLPSISEAIGGSTPQRYIWRICIALHVAPRLMLALMFYNYFDSFRVTYRPKLYNFLNTTASLLHILENLALVLLTYVSSRENYEIHEKGFIAFVVTSILYMITQCVLHKWSHVDKEWTQKEKKSYSYKKWLLAFNVASLAVSLYWFFRHHQRCEAGAYTAFAFFEYLVVASNIAFHGTGLLLELGSVDLVAFSSRSESENGHCKSF